MNQREFPPSPVLTRLEVAQLLGNRTTRFVDKLARAGHLRRITMPGRTRGLGFLREDVERLIRLSVEAGR